MVGLGCNFFKNKKGITLIEALVSTVIIGIGFVAIFQMVQYSEIYRRIRGKNKIKFTNINGSRRPYFRKKLNFSHK